MIYLAYLILAYLFLWLIVPIFLLSITPFRAKKLRVLDNIYGNFLDGLGADFQQKGSRITMPDTWYNRLFPRYFWMVRNPFSNGLRRLGPNGVVQSIHRYGQYITIAKIGGKTYWLFHMKMHYGPTLHYFEIKLGSKLFDDDRTNSKLEVGHKFQNTLAFSFQPFRKEQI